MHIAVLDPDRCHPKRCSHECWSYCPPVRSGVPAIEFSDEDLPPVISEQLCVGCGICPKKCPFDAIKIINIQDELNKRKVHQYGVNSFRLYSLPILKKGRVTALLGQNGLGKTTTLNILSGIVIPNLGDFENPPSKDRVIEYFSGTENAAYFRELYDGNRKVVLKSQYVDSIPKVVKGTIGSYLSSFGDHVRMSEIVDELSLKNSLDKDIGKCSGGELQKFAIAVALMKEGDTYLFDETSSYLDIAERLRVSALIQDLARKKTVMVVEHDLAILDSMVDEIHVVYGTPGAYGVVTEERSANKAINAFLSGFLREENVRIRNYRIEFLKRSSKRAEVPNPLTSWSGVGISLGGFNLKVNPGEIQVGQIIGALGRNSLGKTTFMRYLAGELKSDQGTVFSNPIKISYKPQYIHTDFTGTCEELLETTLGSRRDDSFVRAEIFSPLDIEDLKENSVEDLSGGEFQRLSIAITLARDADLYLLDEPSAHLDSVYRMNASKVVRRVVENRKKSAVVIDHDIYLIDLISDRLMVFTGIPGKEGEMNGPLTMEEGMNLFLSEVGITFRRDKSTNRPRINKKNSALDRLQRSSGNFYYAE